MKHLMKQCLRGMGTLPGVGEHPGTVVMVFFVILGALAGIPNGLGMMFVGVGVMLVVFGPLYVVGAYERAKLSDHIVRRRKND